jgi:superfamily II DNA or RNA helicase
MPPIHKKNILAAEQFLGAPIVAEKRKSGEYVELSEVDVRMAAIAITESMIPQETIPKELTTRLHLLYNLETYIEAEADGLSTSLLHAHQRNVFQDIYTFLTSVHSNDTHGEHLKGYVKLPTGTGKTAIFSTLVDVLNKPYDDKSDRLKALVLVPNLDLVEQTIGKDGKRGFAQFGENTDVSKYTGQSKNLEGDAVVMTYQSLPRAIEKGDIDQSTFDFIILDEAHRALGKKTSAALESVSKDKLVIGMTATPNFKKATIETLLPEKIHSIELREAVEMGLLSRVQGYAIGTDETIETLKSGEYTEGEVSKLIESEWRNNKALEFAKAYIEEGRQGLIACLPGEDLKHARLMAELLTNELILDPKTGEYRHIVARTVAGKSKDRNAVYDAYERGEIDVLTYVDVLTEGWDSEKAKFIINLRPTISPVTAVQRLGRILRRTPNDEIATVIEFVDKSQKPIYTFFHAMGERTIEQGTLIGARKNTNTEGIDDRIYESSLDAAIPENLSEELKRLIAQVNHIELDSLIISPNGAPEDWVMIYDLAEELSRHAGTIDQIADSAGIQATFYRTDYNRSVRFFSPEEANTIRSSLQESIAPSDWTAKSTLIRELKVGRSTFQDTCQRLGIEAELLRSSRGKLSLFYSPQQTALLRSELVLYEQAPEKAVAWSTLITQLDISESTLQSICEYLQLFPQKMRTPRGQVGNYFTEEKIKTIRSFVDQVKLGEVVSFVLQEKQQNKAEKTSKPRNTQPVPENYITTSKLADELEISRKTLHSIANEHDVKGIKIGGSVGYIYTLEEAAVIRQNKPSEEVQDEESVSYKAIAEEAETSQYFVKLAIGRLGLKGTVMRPVSGGRPTEFFNRQQKKEIVNELKNDTAEIPFAPESHVSITELVEESGRSMPYMQSLVGKLPVTQLKMRTKNGHKSLFFTPEDAAIIRKTMKKK